MFSFFKPKPKTNLPPPKVFNPENVFRKITEADGANAMVALMPEEVSELSEHLYACDFVPVNNMTDARELQKRINLAIGQLHSLANEHRHRRNGAPFAEIDDDDLEGIINMLKGTL